MTAPGPSRRAGPAPIIIGILLLAGCAAGAFIDSTTFFAAWLAGWWTCAGMVLGAQANLWLHALTGGTWVEPLRRPLRRAAGSICLLSVLMLPLFLAVQVMYPWADHSWASGLARPAFKTLWLGSGFVMCRLFVYMAVWNALIWFSRRSRRAPRADSGNPGKGYSAFGMLVLGYTISLAAVDLLMALTPNWYSSGFGLLAITIQMKASFALAVFSGARQATPGQRRDLGNLLLMYVLMWGYLAFVQFQIIWAENLPDEIAWYLPRMSGHWHWLNMILIVGDFFLPLLLLLSRSFKESARCLQALAGLLCVMAALESAWLILPSMNALNPNIIWMFPLAVIGMGILLRTWAVRAGERRPGATPPVNQQGAGNAGS